MDVESIIDFNYKIKYNIILYKLETAININA